ncbi:hypothetical protein ACQ4PT_032472 [Festuca glaucescens]
MPTSTGHYQSSCKAPPHCAVCDLDGHTTGMCAPGKAPELKWYGFRVDGVGFYAFDCVPLEPSPAVANSALIVADAGVATEEMLSEGLKMFVMADWDWQVQQVNESNFKVIFPNEDSLRLCRSATAGLTLPGSKIKVIVVDGVAPSPGDVVAGLSDVWVFLRGLPPAVISTKYLMAAMVMIGKPVKVDELSLFKERDTILMLFKTPVPHLLHTTVTLYVNGEGFKIKVVPIRVRRGAGGAAPPPPPRPRGKDAADKEDNDDHDINWKRCKGKQGEGATALTGQGAPQPFVAAGEAKGAKNCTGTGSAAPTDKLCEMAGAKEKQDGAPLSPRASEEFGSSLPLASSFSGKLNAMASAPLSPLPSSGVTPVSPAPVVSPLGNSVEVGERVDIPSEVADS